MTDAKPRNEWICVQEKNILTSPVMEIIERQCKSSEDARLHKFYLLKSRDWCNIIPITEDGKIVLVKQYRIGISQQTLEMPGGVTDPDDEHAKAAAIREMTEETGYVPVPGARCVEIGKFFPNPAIMDNQVYGYVVGPVRREKTQNLDAGEMIEVVELPIEELPQKILNGEIAHALMLGTFLLMTLQSPEGSLALRRRLEGFTSLARS